MRFAMGSDDGSIGGCRWDRGHVFHLNEYCYFYYYFYEQLISMNSFKHLLCTANVLSLHLLLLMMICVCSLGVCIFISLKLKCKFEHWIIILSTIEWPLLCNLFQMKCNSELVIHLNKCSCCCCCFYCLQLNVQYHNSCKIEINSYGTDCIDNSKCSNEFHLVDVKIKNR